MFGHPDPLLMLNSEVDAPIASRRMGKSLLRGAHPVAHRDRVGGTGKSELRHVHVDRLVLSRPHHLRLVPGPYPRFAYPALVGTPGRGVRPTGIAGEALQIFGAAPV